MIRLLDLYKLCPGDGLRYGLALFAKAFDVKRDHLADQALDVIARFARGDTSWQVRDVCGEIIAIFS